MSARGSIHNLEAYARGKMLDHSGWQKGDEKLPRLITPSDFDMVFDNRGWALFCEVSSRHNKWTALRAEARGQVMAYESAVRDTVHCAVLCRHNVPLTDTRPINTRADIDSFQVMVYDPRLPTMLATTEVFSGNGRWQRFVLRFYECPEKIRSFCIESAIQNEEAA